MAELQTGTTTEVTFDFDPDEFSDDSIPGDVSTFSTACPHIELVEAVSYDEAGNHYPVSHRHWVAGPGQYSTPRWAFFHAFLCIACGVRFCESCADYFTPVDQPQEQDSEVE